MARQVIALALVLVAAFAAAVVSARSPQAAPTASPRAQPVASPSYSGISTSPAAEAPEGESSSSYAPAYTPEAYAPVADGPGYAPVSGPAADIAPAPHKGGAATLKASAAMGFAAAAGFMLL